MIAGVLRVAAVASAVVATVSCRSGAGPSVSESWAGDLTASRQLLFMRITRGGVTVSGTGTLASLTNPGGEALTLSGTRSADSLRITFSRATADPFRFVGRYVGPGLAGVLDGAEFVQVAVSFRSR